MTICPLFVSAVLFIANPLFGADLAGAVYDQSGAVIANAAVELRSNPAAKIIAQTKTNSMGLYKLTAIPAGIYDLGIRSPGFRSEIVWGISLAADERKDIAKFVLMVPSCGDTSFTRPAALRALETPGGFGAMSGTLHPPLEGFRLTLLCDGHQPCGVQTTDFAGKYRFTGVKPGEHRIRVEAKGYYDEILIPYSVRAGYETVNRGVALSPCPSSNCATARKQEIGYCE